MIKNCLSILSTSSTTNYNVAMTLVAGSLGFLGYRFLVPKSVKRGLKSSWRYTRNLTSAAFSGIKRTYRIQYAHRYHRIHSHSRIRYISLWFRMWISILFTTWMYSLTTVPSGIKSVWNYTFPDNCKALVVVDSLTTVPMTAPDSPIDSPTPMTAPDSPIDSPTPMTAPDSPTPMTAPDSPTPMTAPDSPTPMTAPDSPIDSPVAMTAPDSPIENMSTDATPSEIIYVHRRHLQDSVNDDESGNGHKHHRRHLGY
jgi:hypothetical protein